MSNQISFPLLTKLKPYKNNWHVQVKCLHAWRQNTSFGDSYEMVLVDEMGNRIHATCKIDHMYQVQRKLPIGEWRVIGNIVILAGGQYRTSSHKYKMTISDESVITASDLSDDVWNICFVLCNPPIMD
ncbi:hypothetical protein N665_1029s0005 [Sinapis alba]|nr:hypothetical protein N665_1029s0005 [Sinapis alba]